MPNNQQTERYYFLSYHLPDEEDKRETTASLGPLNAVCCDVYRDALAFKGITPFVLSGSLHDVEKMIEIEKRNNEKQLAKIDRCGSI